MTKHERVQSAAEQLLQAAEQLLAHRTTRLHPDVRSQLMAALEATHAALQDRRGRASRRDDVDTETLHALRDQGQTLRQIGERVGLTAEGVRLRLLESYAEPLGVIAKRAGISERTLRRRLKAAEND